MNNGLIVSVSPHYHKQGATTQRVMRDVLIALIPALIASVIIFGFRSLLLVAVSAANCVLLEFVWNKLFKKEQTIADLSAVVTGVLIAYNVPVTMPIWQLLIGDFIAVIIVKMLFGGLGCNFVNPALVGRLAMMLSFTESMTDYLHTVTAPGVDLLAGATPLAASGLAMSSFMTLFLGNHGGVRPGRCLCGQLPACAGQCLPLRVLSRRHAGQAEGIRLDGIGSRRQIGTVDRPDALRVQPVCLLTFPAGGSFIIGAHAAVEQQRAFFQQRAYIAHGGGSPFPTKALGFQFNAERASGQGFSAPAACRNAVFVLSYAYFME